MTEQLCKIYLAPLRGVTLRTYRNSFQRHFQGVDIAISPFIPTVNSAKVKPSLMKDVDMALEQLMPIVPQIIGNRPEDIVNMCRALGKEGHKELNWNLGCPHRPVTRKKRGSGLLPHPDMIKAVLDEVFAQGDIIFSVKVRLGLDNPDELYGITGILNDYPLKEIIIHPRTGAQMYEGTVDVDRFEQCLNKITCPVVYNGDINCADDYLKLKKRFPGVDGWMLGRGLISDPFLAEDIKGIACESPSRPERLAGFLDDVFEGYAEELYGPAPLMGRMKELWKYLYLSFEDGPDILRKIQRASSADEYREIVGDRLSR